MMTSEAPLQSCLFAPQDLGARIPADHLLRKVAQAIDLSFVNDVVEGKYGAVGHQSIPPTRIMKLLLLLVIYNVPSERALFRDLPMRIDWLWFLGYDLSSNLPNHSVLSKARKRWGSDVFHELFARTIALCMKGNLIDGRDVLMDSSLIDANASVDSLFRIADSVAAAVTSRLDTADADTPSSDGSDDAEGRAAGSDGTHEPKYRSTTDPDATGAKRRGETRMKPRYQTHRAVDTANGVITATTVGPGHENESIRLEELVFAHTEHTAHRVESVTADSKYGTADNLEFCEYNAINAFIVPFRSNYTRSRAGHFAECCFRYDAEQDVYWCPAGEPLKRAEYRADKDAYRYRASAKACNGCPVRAFCTKGSKGRTIHRPSRIDILERAHARTRTERGRQQKKLRRWMMEGSFAQSVRLGYKRARARGLRNMRIQDFLVATVQNLLILIRANGRKHAVRLSGISLQRAARAISAIRLFVRDLLFEPRLLSAA
jgi:transposase